MKYNLQLIAIAVALLIAGCGGGASVAPAVGAPSGQVVESAPVVAGIATFSRVRGDYTIARATGGYTVTEKNSHVIKNVAGATAIQFSDIKINLAIGVKAAALGTELKSLIELYIAFLNRVPEADELSDWINKLQAGTMIQVAEQLYAEAILSPALSGYGDSIAMTNDLFVTAVYKSVFGLTGATAPTPASVETWSVRIDKDGITRAALVMEMLQAARAGSIAPAASIIQLLDNKVFVGDFFAVQQGINYNSATESTDTTSAIKSAVTSTDIVAAQGMIGFADPSFNLVDGK
jgi:hypothetical protein